MRDQLKKDLPLREVFLGRDVTAKFRTPEEEAKQRVKELADLWLDQHPWARRAADLHQREVDARSAAECCKKPSPKTGRFSSLLASGGALPTKVEAPGYDQQRCLPRDASDRGAVPSTSSSRKPKAVKTAPVIQENPRAKIMALTVARVDSQEDVVLLKRSLESIVAQSLPPRALWMCWYAKDSQLRLLVRELVEDLMPRCIRRGTPLTQLQLEEPVGQWRHVEAVLKARQQMGGDVCDMWVAIAQACEIWHPDRCRRLCEEASAVSNGVPVLVSDGVQLLTPDAHSNEASAVSSQSSAQLPEEIRRWCSSSVLMRLPVLCKFLATLPPGMLGHQLCDLAFCSYAWNEPNVVHLEPKLPWLVQLELPHPAERIVQNVLDQSYCEDPSMEEKQAAFALRRSAGPWAQELLSAADFVRFFLCCHLAAEGLALMQLFGNSGCIQTAVWRRLTEAFQLGEDGFQWLRRQGPEFFQQAKLALGELQEPEEKLGTLLRSDKLSHSGSCNG